MTKIRIEQLLWDEWNIEHVKKHDVSRSEIEEGISRVAAHWYGHSNRIILIGRSGPRMISVIVFKVRTGNYYIVTARDASKKERARVYENEKE